MADVFDALVMKRCYRDGMPFEDAVEIIRDGRGRQFDPRCVDSFIEHLDEIRRVFEKLWETDAAFDADELPV